MTLLWRMGLLRGVMLSSILLVAACSNDDGGDDKECPLRPAFELTVHAKLGALPANTAIVVSYGGGEETYYVETGKDGDVVRCDKTGPDAGDAAQEVSVVHCKLWTQAKTTVTVSANGYPPVIKELKADVEGECFTTVPVEIVLGDEDAGS